MSAPAQAIPETRKSLRKRLDYNWERPEGISKYAPVPIERWLSKGDPIADPLSPAQARLMAELQMEAKNYGGYRIASISQKALGRKVRLTERSVRRNLNELIAKHEIVAADLFVAAPAKKEEGSSPLGRRKGEGNMTPSRFILPNWGEILEAMQSDEAIGKVTVNGAMHYFTRGRGRHILTPEQLKDWHVEDYLKWSISHRSVAVTSSTPEGGKGGQPIGDTSDAGSAPRTQRPSAPPSNGLDTIPPVEVGVAVRKFKNCQQVDDKAVAMIVQAMKTAAGQRLLEAHEMCYILREFGMYKPDAPNAAYIATSIGGRTRAYLNSRDNGVPDPYTKPIKSTSDDEGNRVFGARHQAMAEAERKARENKEAERERIKRDVDARREQEEARNRRKPK